ncbi:hypothetical protein HXX76_013573 [Chlamydomonas incerta]|uniref:Uncharacterized protein n=1 Tax=Chlamydomonas incerta TaxID=51695 RepID=A0A835SEK0_CHLIN|nr:hypothetical protein HXX76_013573 [Chlamydomonas incerta]|eukprot:KAG2425529.1 hypothetical protein HXX76_013573 [Chlamydomonas incerta]
MARVYRSIITGLSLLLGLCIVCSVLLLGPKPFLHRWLPKHGRGGCPLASSESAFRSDSHLLGRLFSGPGLIQLTEGRESYDEVLSQLPRFPAVVVVTAGRGTPTRRTEAQPYISLAGAGTGATGTTGSGTTTTTASTASSSSSPLAALALPLQLMNAGAAAVEAALGRRLFPIVLDTFTRPAGAGKHVGQGPYAIFDASAGRLLLDAGMVAAVWGGGSPGSSSSSSSGSGGSSSTQPQSAYLAEQLSSRLFKQLAAEVAPRAKAAAAAAATAGVTATAGAAGGANAGASEEPRRRQLAQAGGGDGALLGGGGGAAAGVGRVGGVSSGAEVATETAAAAADKEQQYDSGVAAGELGLRGDAREGADRGSAKAQLLLGGEGEGEDGDEAVQQRAFEELDDVPAGGTAAGAAAMQQQQTQQQLVAHKVDTHVEQKQRRPSDAEAGAAAAADGAAHGGDGADDDDIGHMHDDDDDTAAAAVAAMDDRFTGRQSARLGASDEVVAVEVEGGEGLSEGEQEEQQQQGTAAGGSSAGRSSGLGSGAPSSAAAAAATAAVAAAVAAALPAAFAAAPPLWFCILCPSVLGLVAPLAINIILNQVAGALCLQLHLTDDQCFDVLLGALGAGFVLSLASAIPIFFVCRLPECAGRNVTAALRALRGAVPL